MGPARDRTVSPRPGAIRAQGKRKKSHKSGVGSSALPCTGAAGLAIALLGFVLLAATPAAATEVFTVASAILFPAPLVVDGSNNGSSDLFVTINPVFDISGDCEVFQSGGGQIPDPGCDWLNGGVSRDVFIFDLTLDGTAGGCDPISGPFGPGCSEPIQQIDASIVSALFGTDITAAGYFTTLGGSGGTLLPQSIANDPLVSFSGAFDFSGSSAANINAGESTIRLFVTYPDNGPDGNLDEAQIANIRFDAVGVNNLPIQSYIVPEPNTFLLLSGGLTALAITNSARRRNPRAPGRLRPPAHPRRELVPPEE